MPAFLLALLPALSTVLDRVIPDPAAKQKALSEILEVAQKADLAQIDVNKAEAASGSMFVAGWRPFIGWIGGVALAWHFVVKPMLLSFSYAFGDAFVTAVLNAPGLDENMWGLITAMLGIGGLRTFEKIKGVSK
jgi:hypothetical protein